MKSITEIEFLDGEVWLPINGFEGLYEVSSMGRIKSVSKIKGANTGYYISSELLLRNRNLSKGYKGVVLYKNKKRKAFKTHRLVAEHFLNKDCDRNQVNHIDGDKANNRLSNLEWVTNKENMTHSWREGLRDYKGEKSPFAKITEEQAIKISNFKPKKFGDLAKFLRSVGVSYSIGCGVYYGYSWKHLKKESNV